MLQTTPLRSAPPSAAPDGSAQRLIRRPRLTARVEDAVSAGRVALIQAPVGAGKTSVANDWARSTRLGPVAWVSAGSTPSPARLAERITRLLSKDPAGSQGATRIVVVDDVPSVPAAALDDQLAAVLSEHDGVRLLLLVDGDAVLDRHRLGLAAAVPDLTEDDLALTSDEIADVLSAYGQEVDDLLVRAVAEHTAGWAYGVAQVATQLQVTVSRTHALIAADRTIARFLEGSVLRGIDSSLLQVLTDTSFAEEVPLDLARAVSARPALIVSEPGALGFVEVRPDGSFRCHPLLRGLLRRRALLDLSARSESHRRASRWYAGQGAPHTAVRLGIEAGDWTGAARLLVESLVVPRLLVLGTDPMIECTEAADELGAVEPVLLAATALGRSWPDIAEPAIATLAGDRPAGAPAAEALSEKSVADRLSVALVRMVAARFVADRRGGIDATHEALALLPRLSLTQRSRAPELIPLVHAHLGLFELWDSAPDRARAALERGARAFRPKPSPEISAATQVAAADALGQLAWLEALTGELTQARRHASDVLTARPANSTEVGVVHAQLATVLAHVARGEVEQATQRFDAVLARHAGSPEGEAQPALTAAALVTAARLAAVTGDSRSVRGPSLHHGTAAGGWFDHQLNLARAEAELTSGQPAQALQLLRESRRDADVHVLRARAWIALGDHASVAASLRVRPVETVSLVTEVQLELVESWIAGAHGEVRHQRALIDRALRTAAREQLRTPIVWAKTWLHTVVNGDPTLLRRHGAFLASIRPIRFETASAEAPPRMKPSMPVASLTERELDILQRLGSLSTNEEIAADLYLSTNTVKTHLKSLFRKLEVTRRSDAFRRGRTLGLC
ncbi:MAG TPA: LuxR C-terminal-related transcriptional regulator [Microlunatus sp.]|nr:LuxR C-terminal-related transcriptional regulator [Microlunatus sp.]